MRVWCAVNVQASVVQGQCRRFAKKLLAWSLGGALVAVWLPALAAAQSGGLVLQRDGRIISLVPYAPNIVRITMSNSKDAATAAPGYGIVGNPSLQGWTHERDAQGDDVFRSQQMVVRVAPGDLSRDKLPQPMPLDALNLELRNKFFPPVQNPYAPHNDALSVTTADGKMLLHMRTWTMAPESAEVARQDAGRTRVQGVG